MVSFAFTIKSNQQIIV